VAEESRWEILCLLAEGEKCVSEIQEALGMAQSRLSFHLRVLRDAGVVSSRREGRWIYYSLAPAKLEEVSQTLTALLHHGRQAAESTRAQERGEGRPAPHTKS